MDFHRNASDQKKKRSEKNPESEHAKTWEYARIPNVFRTVLLPERFADCSAFTFGTRFTRFSSVSSNCSPLFHIGKYLRVLLLRWANACFPAAFH